MNLNFLKIETLTDLIGKYNLSWFTTLSLTVFSPEIDVFFPIISQIALLFFAQLIAFFVDFARLKWLSERRKTVVNQVKNEIKTEIFDENEKPIL